MYSFLPITQRRWPPSVLDLIRRPSFALKLGRAARVEIETRFSLERMVSAFTTLYRTELSRRTSHAVSYRELAAS